MMKISNFDIKDDAITNYFIGAKAIQWDDFRNISTTVCAVIIHRLCI